MMSNIKFANVLVEVEVLSYYDRPLLVLYRDQDTAQHWLAAWIDESQTSVQWHMIAVSLADLPLLLSTDPDRAITLREAMRRAYAIFHCDANTFDYGSVTNGIPVQDIAEEFMPGDGSFVRLETYIAWDARRKASGTGTVPLTLIDPVQPATPDEPETVPGPLTWPDIVTVPAQLDDDPEVCLWKQSDFR